MGAESKNRITELMIACSRGELARAEELLALGADVNARDRFGYSARMYAAGGCLPALRSSVLRAALHVASELGDAGVVVLLVAGGADPAMGDMAGVTRLLLAARDGDVGLL